MVCKEISSCCLLNINFAVDITSLELKLGFFPVFNYASCYKELFLSGGIAPMVLKHSNH